MIGLKFGDIVQITNEGHHWYPCLVIVSEDKSFGCQGYITMPTNDDKPNSNAFIRLETADYQYVGSATVLLARDEDTTQ